MDEHSDRAPPAWLRPIIAALGAGAAWGNKQRVLLVLVLILALDYADRTLIGALGPTLERAFHFGPTDLGILAAAFSFVSAGATIPIGILADRVSRIRLLAVGLLIWVAAIGATGAAITFAMLLGSRLLLGVVSATTGPTAPSLVGDLVPARARARTMGVINSGQLLGSGVGLLLPVMVLSVLSFRWCFWLLGIAGAVLALALLRLREPERTGGTGPGDAGDAADGDRVQKIVHDAGVKPSPEAVLRRDPADMSLWHAAIFVLRIRTNLIVLIARAVGDFFLASINTFMVIYATEQYGLTQQGADLAILTLGLGAFVGVLVVGRAADALLRRGKLNSRLWLGAAGYILSTFAILPGILTTSWKIALPLFAVGAFFLSGGGPPLDAMRLDVVVPRLRGRAESVRQVLRTAAEGGAPALTGILADHVADSQRAGLQFAFLAILPTVAIGGLLLLLALRSYQPDIAAMLASTESHPAGVPPRRRERRAG